MKALNVRHFANWMAAKPAAEMPGWINPRLWGASMLKAVLPPLPPFAPHIPQVPRNRDYPEVLLLYCWLCFAGSLGVYTLKKMMLSNHDGAYWNVNIRGDIERQSDKGLKDAADVAHGKHSAWWHVAQVKVDKDGANIGVLWDNRTRPHQYSKPGEAGIGAGIVHVGAA